MLFSRAVSRAAAEQRRLSKRETMERKALRESSRPMLLPDNSFVTSFRLTKEEFTILCEEVIPLLPRSRRTTAIRPEIKILAALHFYASGGYQQNLGNERLLCLSQSKMSDCLTEVTEALNSPQILRKYIYFPRSQAARETVSMRFMEKFGFPGVLGCVDGTHCAIIRPKNAEEVYFNRKQYHSLNVLVVCDADLRILYVDASHGGASHDSYVWNACPVKAELQQLHEEGHHFWLLGDSGYAQRPWMMTPILGAAPNSPEEHYTSRHCSTRNVVERCFGVLKSRFRCLLSHRVMHYDPVKAGKIVNACTVLHNLINGAQLDIDEEAIALDRQYQPLQDNVVRGIPTSAERQALVNRLWQSRQHH